MSYSEASGCSGIRFRTICLVTIADYAPEPSLETYEYMNEMEFEHFLDEELRREKTSKIEQPSKLEQWKGYLEQFYSMVDSFLQSYVRENKIEITYSKKILNELYLGEYEVRTASIRIGIQSIKLEPVGSLVVGARGRVDMTGPGGSIKFCVLPKELSKPRTVIRRGVDAKSQANEEPEPQDWCWKIVSSPPVKFTELTKESFLEGIMEVTNA
jgi:hypothetical protein